VGGSVMGVVLGLLYDMAHVRVSFGLYYHARTLVRCLAELASGSECGMGHGRWERAEGQKVISKCGWSKVQISDTRLYRYAYVYLRLTELKGAVNVAP
jgi:hypothetical protein